MKIILIILTLCILTGFCFKKKENFAKNKISKKKCKNLGRKFKNGKCIKEKIKGKKKQYKCDCSIPFPCYNTKTKKCSGTGFEKDFPNEEAIKKHCNYHKNIIPCINKKSKKKFAKIKGKKFAKIKGKKKQYNNLLEKVQNRGKVIVGVSGSMEGFSTTAKDGSIAGFDADFGRALAAAIFGNAKKVEFKMLAASERFNAIKTGDIDVLIRNTTWTQSRDTELGIDFGPIIYYDGQQFMGKVSDGFSSQSTVADIDGSRICVNAGTTTEENIAESAGLVGATITLVETKSFTEAVDKFKAGKCDIITTDGSGLINTKAQRQPRGETWAIFPATPISKEPLAPAYVQNDSVWADIVNWTIYATIVADEHGVTMKNIDNKLKNKNWLKKHPEIARLMGMKDGEIQTKMGLPAKAFYFVIKQVGNYDDIYARNLNPIGLYREGSPNARWKEGGLIYAPPFR